MDKPVVSVCVICYNQELYIADCLNSIVSQVCDFPFEVVVGDDCSTDNTREIIEDFERRFPKLLRCLPKEPNLGVVPNFLRTAKACRGEFIAFCEGDDYWIDPRKLIIQKKAMESHENIDIVFHASVGRYAHHEYGDSIIGFHGTKSLIIPLNEVIVGRGGIIPSASMFFRQNVIHNIPSWFNDMPGCDYHLKVLASARGGAYYVPYLMAIYRKSSHGSWTGRFVNDGELALSALNQAIKDSYRLEALIDFDNIGTYFNKLRSSYMLQIAGNITILRKARIEAILYNFRTAGFIVFFFSMISALLNSSAPAITYGRLTNFKANIRRKFIQLSIF